MSDNIDIDALVQAPELFDSYLAGVQARREANRAKRLRAYWEESVERLCAERDSAIEEGDREIAAELERAIAAFKQALDSTSGASFDHLEVAAPPTQYLDAPTSAAELPDSAVGAPSAAVPLGATSVDEPPPPIDENRRKELSEQAADLTSQIGDAFADPNHDLAFEMHLRSLYCESEALLADLSLADEERATVQSLNGDVLMFCAAAKSEFPYMYASSSAKTWSTLADGYERCAVAADAMLWYRDNVAIIDSNDRSKLLNAIAATQQSLFRHLERIGAKDWRINEFYSYIKEHNESAGWLSGLDQHTSDDELIEIGNECAAIFDDVLAAVEEARSRSTVKDRRDQAVEAVVAWEESLEGRGLTTATLDADRANLCALLDHCLEVGVPPSNVKVRSAILDTASVLLDGQPKYAKFLEAVLAERKRKKMDAVEVEEVVEEPAADNDFDVMRQKVVEFTRGKKVLMLGGQTRPRVRHDLSQVLECELTWQESERTDKKSKFDAVIKKANIVLLLKNFISHELFYHAKELMGENDGHFIVLPAGYGTRQVVSQVAEYMERSRKG